jgi:Ca2+-binding RTX toxin-like protein
MAIFLLDQLSPTLTNLRMFDLDRRGDVTGEAGQAAGFTFDGWVNIGLGRLSYTLLYPAITYGSQVEIAGADYDQYLLINDLEMSGGQIADGRVRVLEATNRQDPDVFFYMINVQIDADELVRALSSPGQNDNYRLVTEQFGRDDVIFASNDGNGSDVDTFSSGTGDDFVVTEFGNDNIWGGNGKDALLTWDGDDRLYGGADNDALFGGAGRDALSGGAGNDLIVGEDGVDRLFGGAGADWFVIETTGERDVIRDFDDGVDRILLADNTLATNEVRYRQLEGERVLVAWDGGGVVVEGTRLQDLTQADLLIGLRAVDATFAQADRVLAANQYLDI